MPGVKSDLGDEEVAPQEELPAQDMQTEENANEKSSSFGI